MKNKMLAVVVGLSLTAMALAPDSLLTAQSTSDKAGKATADRSTATEARIERIAKGIEPVEAGKGDAPVPLDIEKLMKLYDVPGFSVAVIEDYKIAWAKSYGVTEPGGKNPVMPKTLFQAGSISKPVAAAGMLALVQQGKLSLDEDVNVKLKSWRVPENEFTKEQKVTLRRLMSHTAGLTIHGFPGYDVDNPRPTLLQIFNGEKPANTAPIRVDATPGTIERYSGGGITIEQQLMMDVTGKQFPALMRELVLDKIGMSDSSYEQPLPAQRAAMTAAGTYSDGKSVHGKWHVYPEMAAAGLWTTPTDLAKFAIEIALSKQGRSNRVLSKKMTREMLTPVKEDAGLGFFMEKDNPGQFGHNGADEGFQALLTMNADTGNGLAIMANSDNGVQVAELVLRRVAKEYAWNYKLQDDLGSNLFLIAKLEGTAAALQRYEEMRTSGKEDAKALEQNLNTLGYQLLFSGMDSDAVRVFRKNVEDYPQSSNVYDSLGEAYMKIGEKDLAIQNYEKSLQMDPKNTNAVERLKKLRGTDQAADPKIVERDEFTVIGIAARTSNAREMTADGIIGKQWGQLMQEGVYGKIPNKADQNIVAVYTDYASDHNGDYTYLLGARVTSGAQVPEGMVAKKIPAGRFAVFTSDKGAGPKVVPETWMKINSLPKPALERVYRADYEIYDERAGDPQNLVVDVYVG